MSEGDEVKKLTRFDNQGQEITYTGEEARRKVFETFCHPFRLAVPQDFKLTGSYYTVRGMLSIEINDYRWEFTEGEARDFRNVLLSSIKVRDTSDRVIVFEEPMPDGADVNDVHYLAPAIACALLDIVQKGIVFMDSLREEEGGWPERGE